MFIFSLEQQADILCSQHGEGVEVQHRVGCGVGKVAVLCSPLVELDSRGGGVQYFLGRLHHRGDLLWICSGYSDDLN